MTDLEQNDTILSISNLEVSFGAASVIRDVNLTLDRGEILALVGESGSGKSVLGRSILGLVPGNGRVSQGHIHFNGHDVTNPTTKDELRHLRGREIGLIFQEPLSSLNPNLRIGEQMFEAMREHTDLSMRDIRERAIDMLKQVKLENPERLLNRYPHEFSGGMRQRIMIASVMMLKPALLIADEPTTALDAIVQHEVLNIMAEVARAHGTAVILISHDLAAVAAFAQRIAVMEKGELVETGDTDEVLRRPNHDYTKRLLASTQLGVAAPIVGTDSTPLLAVDDLSIDFVEKRLFGLLGQNVNHAVRNVSLAIRPGEFVGLVGESGSGKSTIGRAIAKLVPQVSGTVRFDDTNLGDCTGAEEYMLRRRIRFVFQDPYSSLNPRMRIEQIVREGLRFDRDLSKMEKQARAMEMLAAVGLSADMASRYPHALSGGQRQRVAIARALVSQPDLVIADEPVSALDVTIQAQILDLLKNLQQKLGFACLFISHDLHIVEQLCARLYVLHRGRVMEQAETGTLFSAPRHPYTRRLMSASPRLEQGVDGLQLSMTALPVVAEQDRTDYYNAKDAAQPYQLAEAAPGHFVALQAGR